MNPILVKKIKNHLVKDFQFNMRTITISDICDDPGTRSNQPIIIHPDLTVSSLYGVRFVNTKATKLPFSWSEITGGGFDAYGGSLTTLEGCPLSVTQDFNCTANNLVSLKGGPQKIKGGYVVTGNNLQNLDYLPNKIDSLFVGANYELDFTNFDHTIVNRAIYATINSEFKKMKVTCLIMNLFKDKVLNKLYVVGNQIMTDLLSDYSSKIPTPLNMAKLRLDLIKEGIK